MRRGALLQRRISRELLTLGVFRLFFHEQRFDFDLGFGALNCYWYRMKHDSTFRIVMALWALVVIPIPVFYRLRSQASGEKLDRRQEGWPILLTLRPMGGLCLVGVVAFMVNPSWMAWSSVELPIWLRWMGLGMGFIAAIVWIFTFRSLGKNLTDTVVTRREHHLVTTGPYRWVRHPFYDSVLLCVLSASLLTANWFVLVTGCAVFLLQVVRTGREEQRLLARFGESYLAYTQKTGRFLPQIFTKRGPRPQPSGMPR